jgi:hypothetical protein
LDVYSNKTGCPLNGYKCPLKVPKDLKMYLERGSTYLDTYVGDSTYLRQISHKNRKIKQSQPWPSLSPPPLPRVQTNPTIPINTQQSLPAPYECRTTRRSRSAPLAASYKTRQSTIVAVAYHLEKSPPPPPTFHSHHPVPSIINSPALRSSPTPHPPTTAKQL